MKKKLRQEELPKLICRRIFYVNTGKMAPHRAVKYIERFKEEMKSSFGEEFNNDYKNGIHYENYFIPVGEHPSRIEFNDLWLR